MPDIQIDTDITPDMENFSPFKKKKKTKKKKNPLFKDEVEEPEEFNFEGL